MNIFRILPSLAIRHHLSFALVFVLVLSACNPENKLGNPLNPGGPHSIVSAKVTATDSGGNVSTATWSDADGSGPGAPITSQCKLTLARNEPYDVCLDSCTLAAAVEYPSDVTDWEFNSDSYVSVMARNEANFFIYLSLLNILS